MGFFQKLFGKDKKKSTRIAEEAVKSTENVSDASKEEEKKPVSAVKSEEKTPKPAKPVDTEEKKAVAVNTEENKTESEKAVKPDDKKTETTDAAKSDDKKSETAKNAKPAEKKPEPAKTVKAEEKKPEPAKAPKPAPENKNDKDAALDDEASEDVIRSSSGRFEIKKAKDGRFVFNLYASNHVIIATSQIHSSTQSAINGINSVIKNAPIAEIEDRTLQNYTEKKNPKWEIYLDNGGQYRFRLNAPNGDTICHSQGYTSKANCKNGIDSIIRHASSADIDKIYLKKNDEEEQKS